MTGGKKMYIEFIENLFKCGWRQYSIVQTTFTLLMIPYSKKKNCVQCQFKCKRDILCSFSGSTIYYG